MSSILDAIEAQLVDLDKDANGTLGGDRDQTISARAWATSLAGDDTWRAIIDNLFYKGHCENAWITEMAPPA